MILKDIHTQYHEVDIKATKIFIKLFCFLVLIAVGCYGQNTGQNVVNSRIVQATYTSNQTLISGNLQNIGQTSHIVKATFTSVSGTVVYGGVIQGSNNGTTWFNIGPVIDPQTTILAPGPVTITLVGYGSFPFLRIDALLNVSGSATLNETYVGTSAPVFNNVDQYSANNGIGNVTVSTLTYGSSLQLFQTGFFNSSLVVYGFSLFGPSTLTDFILGCSSDGMVFDKTIAYIKNATGRVAIVFPSSLRAYGACNFGDFLYYEALGSGADAVFNVEYRVE